MKQAITLNKLAIRDIRFERERLNEQETSLDNLQDSLSTPFPGCSPIPRSSSPASGRRGWWSQIPSSPSSSWTTSIPRSTRIESQRIHKNPAAPQSGAPPHLSIGLARALPPPTPPSRRSRGSTSRGWSGLPCPTPGHWSRCLYQRVPHLFAVFSLLME